MTFSDDGGSFVSSAMGFSGMTVIEGPASGALTGPPAPCVEVQQPHPPRLLTTPSPARRENVPVHVHGRFPSSTSVVSSSPFDDSMSRHATRVTSSILPTIMRSNCTIVRSILVALLALVATFAPALAQIPATISYQGIVTDDTGQPLTGGTRPMTFSLFDVATGGTPLWSETHPAVAIDQGLFSVRLGTNTPLTLPFTRSYWLGVTISGGGELSPRTELTSSAYTFRAMKADSAMAIVRDAVGGENLRSNAVGIDHLSAAGSSEGQVLTSTGTGVVWRTVSTQGVGGVSSLNGGTGAMELVAGTGINVLRNGGDIIISAEGGSGAISTIGSSDPVVSVMNGNGPNVSIGLNTGSITDVYLATDAVTTGKIRNGSVTGDKIVDGTITTADLADNVVTSAKIVDGDVRTADLSDGNVTTGKLADGAVTSGKLGDGSVTTAKLGDESVTTGKLGDASVTTSKLADGSATSSKLADGAVTTGKLGDGSVTTAKLAQNAVDASRMSTGSATAGAALMSNGGATPVWGNPTASDLALPYSKTASNSGSLVSITNNGAGATVSFAISSGSNSSNSLEATTNGTGYAARVTGTGSASEGLYLSAASSGRALTINQGRVVLSYGAVASGGAIGVGFAVVEVQSNGTAASAAVATLPAYTSVENGTMIVVATSDPDGAVITGTGSLTYDIAAGESRVFIRISNGWKGDF